MTSTSFERYRADALRRLAALLNDAAEVRRLLPIVKSVRQEYGGSPDWLKKLTELK